MALNMGAINDKTMEYMRERLGADMLRILAQSPLESFTTSSFRPVFTYSDPATDGSPDVVRAVAQALPVTARVCVDAEREISFSD